MRPHSVSSVFAAALTLLGLCAGHAGAQTFKAKFGTGVWTAFGSVHSPKDDLWTPGVGPGGEFWTSPGGVWRPTAGSSIRNPLRDTWVQVASGNAVPSRAAERAGPGRGDIPTVRAPGPNKRQTDDCLRPDRDDLFGWEEVGDVATVTRRGEG